MQKGNKRHKNFEAEIKNKYIKKHSLSRAFKLGRKGTQVKVTVKGSDSWDKVEQRKKFEKKKEKRKEKERKDIFEKRTSTTIWHLQLATGNWQLQYGTIVLTPAIVIVLYCYHIVIRW